MFSQTAESISGAEDIPVPRLERLANVLTHLAALGGSAISATPGLTAELLKIWAGTSSVEPQPGDWRFRNPAWGSNPLYRRVAQSYLAWADAVTRLPEAIDGQDWRAVEQARFLLGILTTAFAPTNFFLGNPAAIERAFETGGQSILTGLKSYLHDLVHNRGMPAQVDLEPFRVGENMAATPGAVVFRNEICELLQYRPTTPSVRSQPMLVIPPPIGRYYFLDLRPKRSFVEYAVSRGLPVFMISWRNARPEGRDWDMDTYGAALIEALDAAHQICGSPDANVLGFCAGGILLSTVLNHLAAHRDRRIGAVSLAVTLLDFDMPAAIGTFSPGTIISVAQSRSAKKGILPAQDLGAVFTWLRPNDLVWNYWVNNYLLGQKPPAIDLMAWNADGTNLPAALHRQFLEIFGKNLICKPGRMTVLGAPIDLGRIRYENYVMAAISDHLTPWKGCYRATQLLTGPSTFVLSNSGHIAGLVNPPGNLKAKYFAGPEPGPDPDLWLAQASERSGTWWEHWADWAIARSGEERPAPAELGSAQYQPLEPAPGRYVFS